MDDSTVGPWIAWNGGECPEHPKTVVDCTGRCLGSDIPCQEYGIADAVAWERFEGAYRVVKEHKEQGEFWLVDTGDGMLTVNYTDFYGGIHVSEVTKP